MFLFGNRKSPPEILKENQRTLTKAIRDIDRERLSLEVQEKNYISAAKRAAKAGHMSSVKIIARDAVRVRSQIDKFFELRTQLQAIFLRLQTLKSMQTIATVMAGVTKAMKAANSKTDTELLSSIIRDFERQNKAMERKGETLDGAIDSMIFEQTGKDSEEDTEMAANELVDTILREVGVAAGDTLTSASAPSQTQVPEPRVPLLETAASSTASSASTETFNNRDAELEARLQRLRK